jgi:hypothetical protein
LKSICISFIFRLTSSSQNASLALAKSKSSSVVAVAKADAIKERLKRLNDLEKENRTSIDQTSSDEDNNDDDKVQFHKKCF